jgi:hypothetical protein
MPSLVVELSTEDILADPVWIDISDHAHVIEGASVFASGRGHQHELDRVEAGSATVVLANDCGCFDPFNPDGPYYPDLGPMNRVRARALWASTSYPLFDGYVEEWPLSFPNPAYGQVALTVVEGLAQIAAATVALDRGVDTASERVDAVLDAIAWPTNRRDVSATGVVLPEIEADVNALAHLFDVQRAENGRLFYSADGLLVFQDRETWYGSVPVPGLSTWGDQRPEYAYDLPAFRLQSSAREIRNDIRMTREGGVEQVVEDAASIDRFGRRTYGPQTLLLTTDDEVLEVAQFLSFRYAQPGYRLAEIRPLPDADDSWAAVLGAELGDRIWVRRRPPNAAEVERLEIIEHIAHQVVPGDRWTVTWRTSPADASVGFWRVGNAVWGILGQTTRLGL